MNALRLTPAFLSCVLLAAHFWRADSMLLTFIILAGLGILFVPRPWAARTLQAVLALGALEWLRTTLALAQERLAAGEPWHRLACILGAVALISLLAALAFEFAPLKRFYGRLPAENPDRQNGAPRA